MKRRMAEYRRRRAAWLARPENRLCEAHMMVKELIAECCDDPPPATQVHHRRGRGLGRGRRGQVVDLLNYEPLWHAVSLRGHQWIDANRERARELGLLAARGDWLRTDDLPEAI